MTLLLLFFKDPGQRYVVVKVDLPSPERLTETPATKGADVSQMIPFDFSTQSISDTRSKPSTRMGRMEQPAPSSIFLDSQSDIHSENNSVSEAASAIVDSIIKVFQTPKVLNDESSVTNRDDADVMPITDSINGDSLTSARRCLNEDNLAEGQDIFPISVPDAIVESTKSDQKSKEILISPSKQKSSSEKNHAKKEKRSVVLEDMEKRSTEHKSANVKNEIKDIKDEKRKIQKVKSKPKLIIENHNQQSVVRRKDPIDYKDTMNSLDIRQQHIYPQQDDMPTTPSSLGSQDSKDHDHLLKDDEPAKLRQTDKRSSNFIRQLNDDELSGREKLS